MQLSNWYVSNSSFRLVIMVEEGWHGHPRLKNSQGEFVIASASQVLFWIKASENRQGMLMEMCISIEVPHF